MARALRTGAEYRRGGRSIVLRPHLLIMGAGSSGTGATPIADAERKRDAVSIVVARMVRRGHRFSWLAWGSVMILLAGVLALVILTSVDPVTRIVTTGTGTSETSTTYTTTFWWGYPLCFAPGAVTFALAVRELVIGRNEMRRARLPVAPTAPPSGEGPATWVEVIQLTQKDLSRIAVEVEWSYLPLAIGLLMADGIVASYFAYALFPIIGYGYLGSMLVGLLFMAAALYPIYRCGHRWVVETQATLDRQVQELAQLETEFFWRYGGSGPTG